MTGEDKPSRGPWMVVILGLAAILRLGWLAYASPAPVSDAAMYLDWAREMIAHGQFGWPVPTAYTVPGYPAFLALLLMLVDSVLWLKLVNVALGVLTCWLVALTARRLFPDRERLALLAALVCALNPTFIFYSPLLVTENIFAPLMLAILLVALSRLSGGRAAIIAGLLLGAGMMIRAETGIYAPVIFFMFLLDRAQAGEGFKLRLTAALMVFVVTVAVVSPWLWRNNAVMGMGMSLSNGGGMSLYLGNNPYGYNNVNDMKGVPKGLGEVERNRLAASIAKDYLKANPGRIPALVAKKTYHLYRPTRMPVFWSTRGAPQADGAGYTSRSLWGEDLFNLACVAGWAALFILALCGLWNAPHWPRRTRWVLGGMVLGNWLMYGAIFVAIARYRYFVEVLCCLAAAAFIDHLREHQLKRRPPLQGVREDGESLLERESEQQQA